MGRDAKEQTMSQNGCMTAEQIAEARAKRLARAASRASGVANSLELQAIVLGTGEGRLEALYAAAAEARRMHALAREAEERILAERRVEEARQARLARQAARWQEAASA
jgi:hypothetical protein